MWGIFAGRKGEMNADTLYPHELLINWLYDNPFFGIMFVVMVILLFAGVSGLLRPETTCCISVGKVCC